MATAKKSKAKAIKKGVATLKEADILHITGKPLSLGIARDDVKMTYSWKIGDTDYGNGQGFMIHELLNGKWEKISSVNLGAKVTSRSVNWSNAKTALYPYTSKKMAGIRFSIFGSRKNFTATKKSGATKITTYHLCLPSTTVEKQVAFGIPAAPSVGAAFSEENDNETTFSWSVATASTDFKPFAYVQWESVYVLNSNITDGAKAFATSKLGRRTGTGNASGSVRITEDSTSTAKNSVTRWFRARSRGCAGDSGWKYAKHVYAKPYAGNITKASGSIAGQNTTIQANWTTKQDASHPIDTTMLQYCIVVPGANVSLPSGASWQDAVQVRTDGSDGARVTVEGAIDNDEVMFLRVRTTHDRQNSYGTPATAMIGKLKPIDSINASQDPTTYRATVTVNNTTQVPDAKTAVFYRLASKPSKNVIMGIIPAGEDSVTIQCPDWSRERGIVFGAFAFVGTAKRAASGEYSITKKMSSDTITTSGTVAKAPADVSVVASNTVGEAIVSWSWTWDDADGAEISWADNENAWESTRAPSTFVAPRSATSWRVSELETGVRWFFRVRQIIENSDTPMEGPYGEQVDLNLASAPSIPVLQLSKTVMSRADSVTATWAYATSDGTAQAYAEICEATLSGEGITYGRVVAYTTTAQRLTIPGSIWEDGSTHYLCVRVTSASGQVSDDWSAPVPIKISTPLTCEITQTSLTEVEVPVEGDEPRMVTGLQALPMTVTAVGAGDSGTTIIAIERAEAFHAARPDETEFNGYEGETIALMDQIGEGQMTITTDDLIGALDDGGRYRLVATVQDDLGQSAEDSVEFEVHWSHQAERPTAIVEIDQDQMIAIMTPVAPEGAAETDVCDIYRLSTDRPELIYRGATFGEKYVDPYPAIGLTGGHRFVTRTSDGDYTTADNELAWYDTTTDDVDFIESNYTSVDYGSGQVNLQYNVDVSHQWSKDFQETKYLGGSIQGDWNPAVSRTGSISAVSVPILDSETLEEMRRLATHAGICHVRTKDGSSFNADVQVSESHSHDKYGQVINFSLSVTRVDAEELDGMTWDEWQEIADELG